MICDIIKKNVKKCIFYSLLGITTAESIYLGSNYIIGQNSTPQSKMTCVQEKKKDRYACWQAAIESSLKNGGVESALDAIAGFYARQPEFANDCHAFVHLIGNKAARLYLQHEDVTLTTKISYCAYGFFHGFIEALIQLGGSFADARSFCKYAAGRLETLYQAEDSCYHGIGHGVTDGSDPRAWGDSQAIIQPGLDSCRKIALKSEQLKSCATGVFNSLAIMTIGRKNKLTPNTKEPYAICVRQEKSEYQQACLEQMNTLVMHVAEGQFAKAIPFVFSLHKESQQKIALFSLAATASAGSLLNAQEQDIQGAEICHTLSPSFRTDCIRGFLGGLMEHGTPGYEYQRAYAFCTLSLLTVDEKKSCLEFLTIYSRSLYTFEKMQDVCNLYESSLKEWCKLYTEASFLKSQK